MLEQAIADAAALREQAIKNAEQSVLDKYSKQIKEAVDQMLETDEPSNLDIANETINEAEEELMQEEDMAATAVDAAPAIEAMPAYDSRPEANDIYTKLSAVIDNIDTDADGMINLDLGDFSAEEEAAAEGDLGDDLGGLGDLGGDLLGGDAEDAGDDPLADDETETMDDELDFQLQEVLGMLQEEDVQEQVVEEEMKIDYEDKLTGNFDVGSPEQKYNAEMAQAVAAQKPEEEEEDDSSKKEENELYETVEFLINQNNQMEDVLTKMENYLEETLLSNAKLLYQNRTLADASLNERQKSKIVEAIANAESPKEAKKLHETLKATVGSTPNRKRDPQSLSESVNRRSNLSSMLNSRQNINESKQSNDSMKEKMQKLAGIKK